MKSKKLIIISALLIFLVLFVQFYKKPEVEIDYKNSFYSSYSIKDDKVFIECELTINNNTKTQKDIQILGTFEDDANIGLLKNPTIYGYDTDLATNTFNIDSGSHKITVIFIGDYNGVNIKHNRNLPKIQLLY